MSAADVDPWRRRDYRYCLPDGGGRSRQLQPIRSVGAWLGLTTRRYQSGEVYYDGHISRLGDTHVRSLLYEAAVVILTRCHADSDLRVCMKLREKVGFNRAAVAVARKLAVIMHAMLRSGELFTRTALAA